MKQILLFLLVISGLSLSAQDMVYQRPPQVIEEAALAPARPLVKFSKSNEWMLLLDREPYYSINELAQPELRLAGVRINPQTYSESRQRGYTCITIKHLKKGKTSTVTGLPVGCTIMDTFEYPSADRILIAIKKDDGLYLYSASYHDTEAKLVSSRKLSATLGIEIAWINDTDFYTLVVPSGNLLPPTFHSVPIGPVVQQNIGRKTAARTYQDLLKNKQDEALFDYYFTSQLVKITSSGEQEVNSPAVYTGLSISPDKTLLLVGTVHKPYSYIVPMNNFPSSTTIINLEGQIVKKVIDTPVVIPAMGYDTTSPYPRRHAWRPDKPSTLYWVEAQDGGNPKEKPVEYADIVYQQEAPFTTLAQEVTKTQKRFNRIDWCDDNFALLSESSRATRTKRIYSFKPCNGEMPKCIFDLSTDDNYNDPGSPCMVRNQYDRNVLYVDKNYSELLMISEGASPEGDMPFISKYNLAKNRNNIIWRCKAPYYESIYDVIDPKKLQIITVRQSQTEPANFFLKDLKKRKNTALTFFANPYPMMKGVKKEKIRYKRADGLDLTATVYLPAGYDSAKDGRLPVFMWAYPREYRSATDAAQVRGSQYTFTNIGYGSPVFWVMRGYCVMDNVEMPIVGSDGKEPNDNYIEQLVMDAEAAVKAITDMGVGDPDRIGVGGHSYGAFMTANLLTHTKLFKAGIARSGAYNRTLTPFGFQAETRTYWEAPEVYNTMSPFMYANKLSGAMLLVHGELDNNMGTFPIQSERFYQALKGHGAIVRYVVLPLESHGYSAKENILHLLYEEDMWLEKYVKGRQ